MKKLLPFFMALIMLFSVFSFALSGHASTLPYAEKQITQLQSKKGYIPGTRAVVTGNCYAFVSKVCEHLYGVAYQEGIDSYTCRHDTGYYYTVAEMKATSTAKAQINNVVTFFKSHAMPGDVVHYASLSSPRSMHTVIIQSIDNEKMTIYHSNFGSDNCRTDTIYWSSFLANPTKNGTVNGKTSANRVFYCKMQEGGAGFSINRYVKYTKVFFNVGSVFSTIPSVSVTRGADASLNISWKKVNAATKYQVDYKLSSDKSYKSVSVTGTSYTLKGLTYGNNYHLRVRSYCNNKWMDYSAVTTVQALPIAVNGLDAVSVKDGVKLTFKAQNNVTGYSVLRSTSEKGSYQSIGKVNGAKTTAYTDKNVALNKAFYYKVQSYVTKNGKTYYGAQSAAFKAAYSLGAPAVRLTNAAPDAVKVSWKAVPNADSYQLMYKAKGGQWVTRTGIQETSFTVSKLRVDTKFYFKVRAVHSKFGAGKYGATQSVKALPPTPALQSLSKEKKGIRVEYSLCNGVTGYRIYRSTTKNGKYTLIRTILNPEKDFMIDGNVKKNKKYYYKVESYYTKGRKTVASSFSKVRYYKYK